MNCGLGNLADLKNWLLPSTLQSDAGFAAQLPIVGRGVAGMFEIFCNRKFERVVDNVETFPADRTKHVTTRYPIESISRLEIKQVEQDGWADLPDLVVNLSQTAGVVYFYGQQGWQRGQIRLTYTGGFWFETLESSDPGFPSAMPAGATALPAALKFAWLQQCAEVWKLRAKLGIPVTSQAMDARTQSILARSLDAVPFLPDVRQVLSGLVRYQMS